NTINKVKFENPVVKILDTEFKFEINEEFYPSDIVYIDAKSGAGKSTLLRSLLNIRDVDGIFINEKEVNSLSLDELREKVAYVPQNPLIIPASLRENILVDTVKDKSIDEKILSMDVLKPVLKNKNLDSEILANGENLSGGEKQRVSIVRSLMRNADVYIFDEITSNLDSESQEDFFSNFIKDIDNKIVFIISHDKKVQKYCNKTMHVK
ncbi:MAG: ATP-binding cassette domain-containing protein, partial [Finegoldia magna]|nr:ATP-binding cassette domain-containing protein [Finegoldia magna]